MNSRAGLVGVGVVLGVMVPGVLDAVVLGVWPVVVSVVWPAVVLGVVSGVWPAVVSGVWSGGTELEVGVAPGALGVWPEVELGEEPNNFCSLMEMQEGRGEDSTW